MIDRLKVRKTLLTVKTNNPHVKKAAAGFYTD